MDDTTFGPLAKFFTPREIVERTDKLGNNDTNGSSAWRPIKVETTAG